MEFPWAAKGIVSRVFKIYKDGDSPTLIDILFILLIFFPLISTENFFLPVPSGSLCHFTMQTTRL